jgi:hypothetical protein
MALGMSISTLEPHAGSLASKAPPKNLKNSHSVLEEALWIGVKRVIFLKDSGLV